MMEIAGYPGEKTGYPDDHFALDAITETHVGGCIVSYATDTTPGNSGSAVKVVDPERVKARLDQVDNKAEFNSDNYKKMTIAMHTGSDTTKVMNYGTLITPAMGA